MGYIEGRRQEQSQRRRRCLTINPLAWVCKVDDITQYYDDDDSSAQSQRECSSSGSQYYLICISFAGNEMHEPSVKIVVKDEQDPREILDANNAPAASVVIG